MQCPHATKSQSRAKIAGRRNTNLMYDENNPCQVKGYAKENYDSSVTIKTLELNHNHATNKELYGRYESVRKRKEKAYESEWAILAKSKEKPSTIAKIMSEKLNLTYTSKDISNRLKKAAKESDIN